MGNCIRDTTHDHEVQTLPVETEENQEVKSEYSMTSRVQAIGISATSSFAFRPEELFAEKSFEMSKSLEHLTKALDQSHLAQEGDLYIEKFHYVLEQTKMLEEKLEDMKRTTLESPPMIRLSTQSPGRYLQLEQELERQMSTFREEIWEIKKEVDGLTKQTKDIAESN